MGKNYQDFAFILNQLEHFNNKPDPFPPEDKMEYLYNLPHPNGGMMVMGSKANEKFFEIAERQINGNQLLDGKIKTDALVKVIKKNFVNDIIAEGKALNDSTSDKIVSKSVKYILESKIKTLTHFFPCILPPDSETSEFYIGPVCFTSTDKFLKDKHDKLQKNTNEIIEIYLERDKKELGRDLTEDEIQQAIDHAKIFEKDLKEYFEQFPWILALKITGFEQNKSREISELGIQLAINIVRLFFPTSHAHRIQSYGRPQHISKKASLHQDESKNVHVSLSTSYQVYEETGWVEKLLKGNAESWVVLIGSLIPHFISGNHVPLLYQRYINALWWYGEALSDNAPYIKITSLANALEAVLGTSDTEIAEQIAFRASKLIGKYGDTEDWKKKIKSLYNVRSRLVHGDTAAFDPEVETKIWSGLTIVSKTLIEIIPWMHYLASEQCLNSLDQIHEFFENKLDEFCDGKIPNYPQ